MKVPVFVSNAVSTANKVAFKCKKSSPETLVILGVTGVVTAAVMACMATTKIGKVKEEEEQAIKECEEKAAKEDKPEETVAQEKKIIKVQSCVKYVRLYAPAVAIGLISLSCILASHGILKKRNAAIAAAYAAVEKSFDEYRSRVVERFGEEVDNQLLHNTKQQKVEETVVDENGKEKKVKKTVDVADPDAESPYMKYFTKANPYWENDLVYVENFLRAQQNYANDKLRKDKVLTLNAVYEMLGFPISKAGLVVGWIYDDKNPVGDNFVDFNVTKVYLPGADGSLEVAYAIDFNVDGCIYDRMV